ncbi:hypothetical protein [Butyricicoccus sp.]|uniref:hypothetical protein n=1 Tax=Butyricicoccus sp. TaxID=2049021 RepID=UPI003F14694F
MFKEKTVTQITGTLPFCSKTKPAYSYIIPSKILPKSVHFSPVKMEQQENEKKRNIPPENAGKKAICFAT